MRCARDRPFLGHHAPVCPRIIHRIFSFCARSFSASSGTGQDRRQDRSSLVLPVLFRPGAIGPGPGQRLVPRQNTGANGKISKNQSAGLPLKKRPDTNRTRRW